MGPSATNLVRQHSAWNISPLAAFQVFRYFTQDIARAFHQSKQEEVQEGVADHVAHVDHHLVVDKGGRGEPNSDQHCPRAQDRRSEQAAGEVCYRIGRTHDCPPEISEGGLLVSLRHLLQSWGEIWGRCDPVGLGDLGEDLRRLLGSRLGDQPARGLREQSPREEEEDERGNRDNLDQSPGGDQPAWETELSGKVISQS